MVSVWPWLTEGINATVSVDGLNFPDKRVHPGYWLRSGFESPRRQLVLSLFLDPISYGRLTGATLHVPCLDWRLINWIHFSYNVAPVMLPWLVESWKRLTAPPWGLEPRPQPAAWNRLSVVIQPAWHSWRLEPLDHRRVHSAFINNHQDNK